MTKAGIVANFRGACPSAREVESLGLVGGWVRSIAYDLDSFDGGVSKLEGTVNVCGLISTELAGVGSDFNGIEQACNAFGRRFQGRVQAVEIENEADLKGIPIDALAAATRVAGPILRDYGMTPILSSVAGPDWQGYIEQLADRTQGYVDLACLHPYGQRARGFPPGFGFGEIDGAVRRASELSGLRMAITETGIKIGDAGSAQRQAYYWGETIDLLSGMDEVEFFTMFCWCDSIGSPGERGESAFGMRDEQMQRRPAWFTMQSRLGGAADGDSDPMPWTIAFPPQTPGAQPERVPQFVLGFNKWATLEPTLIGSPLRNELTVAPEWQTQPTSTGILSWVGGKGHAFVTHDGSIWRWQEDWDRSVKIA